MVRSGWSSARCRLHFSITSTRSFASLSPLRAVRCALAKAFSSVCDVGEHQLGFDRFDIRQWIDRPRDMGDIGILETTDDLNDRIDLADMAEEFVAQPSPSAAPLTIPAMSTNLRAAGITFLVPMYVVIRPRRSSGTFTIPSFGSIVQNG